MAIIISIDANNTQGARVLNAIRKINEGLGDLHELEGLRANAIGVNVETMAATFGVSNGQTLSDRMVALQSAYSGYAALRDLIEATITTSS